MPNRDSESVEYISSSEAAALLGLAPRYFSETFIYKHEDFPAAIRYGARGHRRYDKAAVLAWQDSQRGTTC